MYRNNGGVFPPVKDSPLGRAALDRTAKVESPTALCGLAIADTSTRNVLMGYREVIVISGGPSV